MKAAAMILAAGAACSVAAADEPPPTAADLVKEYRLTVPVGWIELPRVAEAARGAAVGAAKDVVTAVGAWGDPAAGCYAVLSEHRGARGESLDASVKRLYEKLAGLGVAMPDPKTKVGDVVDLELPIAAKELDLAGSVRVRLYRAANIPQATLLACFHNQREPDHCRTLCKALDLQLAPP
jgi:hypothetical protein